MKSTVYIETTVISYLTARATTDPLLAGDIDATKKWWDNTRGSFELFTSEIVIQEASRGDAKAAAERLSVLGALPGLPVTSPATALAKTLVSKSALPRKARVDALHISIAAANGMNYLLTWNCRHLANATLRARIEQICRDEGYEPPVICTPKELTEVQP
jgi:predicted nucleic acid-binding protein